MTSASKRALRRLLRPLAGAVDSRFSSLHDHVDVSVDGHLRPHLDARMDTVEDLERAIGVGLGQLGERFDRMGEQVHEDIGRLGGRLDRFEARVTTDAQVAAELSLAFRRTADRLLGEVLALRAAVVGSAERPLPLPSAPPDGPPPPAPSAAAAELVGRAATPLGDAEADRVAALLHEAAPAVVDAVVGRHAGHELAAMGPGAARYLNWAVGHLGPSAQGRLWFNPPVSVEHVEGAVHARDVNERVVELPYVLAAVGRLEPGSAVLDFGAAESTVGLSLASLGLRVTALDLRPYPLEHPNLRSVVGPVQDWEGPPPDDRFDAVVSLSTLEHVGLGAYGEPGAADGDGDLDRRVLERLAGWLRPGGELVLTAPYGAWSRDDLQRVYDREHLDALLAGWRVLDRRVCVRTARDRWERVEGEPPAATWADGTAGVVLLRATPEA